MRTLHFGFQLAMFIAASALSTVTALASSSCYEQAEYPAILRMEAIGDEGFRVYMSSPDYHKALVVAVSLADKSRANANPSERLYRHPVIAYGKQKGFSQENPAICHINQECKVTPWVAPTCTAALPSTERLIENALRTDPSLVKKPLDHTISFTPHDNGIDQGYGACMLLGGKVWFGISYYDGEGITGIGGVGRYDTKTRKMELRRPEVLRGSSVSRLFHDGKYLWLGTAGNYECTGTPPTLGLVRYDWKTRKALTFLDENDGPCGLLVNEFLQLGDDLWVATDLGLSRWNRKTAKWQNYLPEPDANPPMREMSCPDLYRQLAETLPRSGWNEVMPAASPYHQLMETLAHLRPRAIDAATLADSLFHVFFPRDDEPGEQAYLHGDFKAAVQIISRHAENRDIQAQYNLGTMYARGNGVERDFAVAASWLRKAAARGHTGAQANLGLLLLNRAQTKAEWLEAKQWLRKASAKGSQYAKTALLLMEHSVMPASLNGKGK